LRDVSAPRSALLIVAMQSACDAERIVAAHALARWLMCPRASCARADGCIEAIDALSALQLRINKALGSSQARNAEKIRQKRGAMQRVVRSSRARSQR
jgi:hypothetical protein